MFNDNRTSCALTWNTTTMPAIMEYMSYLPSCLPSAELIAFKASRYCFNTFLPMLASTSEVFPSRYSFIQLPWAFSATRNCSKPGSVWTKSKGTGFSNWNLIWRIRVESNRFPLLQCFKKGISNSHLLPPRGRVFNSTAFYKKSNTINTKEQ